MYISLTTQKFSGAFILMLSRYQCTAVHRLYCTMLYFLSETTTQTIIVWGTAFLAPLFLPLCLRKRTCHLSLIIANYIYTHIWTYMITLFGFLLSKQEAYMVQKKLVENKRKKWNQYICFLVFLKTALHTALCGAILLIWI